MTRPDQLHGDGFRLLTVRPEHFEFIVTHRNDPQIAEQFTSQSPFSLEGQRRWHERYLETPSDLSYLIEAGSPPAPVGMVGVYDYDPATSSAQFGRIFIVPGIWRRRGLAFSAAALLIENAFSLLSLNRLYLDVFADNLPALALYHRLGFVPDQSDPSLHLLARPMTRMVLEAPSGRPVTPGVVA